MQLLNLRQPDPSLYLLRLHYWLHLLHLRFLLYLQLLLYQSLVPQRIILCNIGVLSWDLWWIWDSRIVRVRDGQLWWNCWESLWESIWLWCLTHLALHADHSCEFHFLVMHILSGDRVPETCEGGCVPHFMSGALHSDTVGVHIPRALVGAKFEHHIFPISTCGATIQITCHASVIFLFLNNNLRAVNKGFGSLTRVLLSHWPRCSWEWLGEIILCKMPRWTHPSCKSLDIIINRSHSLWCLYEIIWIIHRWGANLLLWHISLIQWCFHLSRLTTLTFLSCTVVTWPWVPFIERWPWVALLWYRSYYCCCCSLFLLPPFLDPKLLYLIFHWFLLPKS